MHTQTPLFTDQYELVMAYGYWRLGMAEQEAVFHLYFRKMPFKGNYVICCGLDRVIELFTHFKFTEDDLAYVATLQNPNGTALVSQEFIDYLSNLSFSCDVDAISEGTLVFAQEPMIRIKGPLLQCQLLETAIINYLNFPSLVATKASLVCQAAQGDEVVEFGARRAQGPDGALTASRAAYVGGCVGTSNVLAGKCYGIPALGTQAHSWIMAFADELSSFTSFVQVMPDNAVLLVDTYETIAGVKNAIIAAQKLRKQGKELLAIRLDSGDLADLSKKSRMLLDKAGFTSTKIMASGDLDEYKIAALKTKKAPIDAWGVGTRLATSADQPYMDMAYKLAAIKDAKGQRQYKIKISNQPTKTTTPGIHQVRRYYQQQKLIKDIIYDVEMGISDKLPAQADQCEDLLVPIFRQGKLVYLQPSIEEMRDTAIKQANYFIATQKRAYNVELEPRLESLKNKMIK